MINPDEYDPQHWGTLIKQLASETDQYVRMRIRKNRLGRLRRQRGKWSMNQMAQEVGAAVQRLTALGWEAEGIGKYVAAMADNFYETELIRDLRRCYKEDMAKGDDDWAVWARRCMAREFPLLWAALESKIEE